MMPTQTRFKTKYPGVSYVEVDFGLSGEPERIYYIRYRKDGKLIEEKAGRQFQDDMTPHGLPGFVRKGCRGGRVERRIRQEEQAAKEAEAGRWTIARLWEEYKNKNPDLKGIVTDENRFKLHRPCTSASKEPKELVPLDVDRLRLRLMKDHQPRTVKNALELLRRIINFGVKKQLCDGPTLQDRNADRPQLSKPRTSTRSTGCSAPAQSTRNRTSRRQTS